MDTLSDSMARINLDSMMRSEVDSLEISLSLVYRWDKEGLCVDIDMSITLTIENEMTVLRRLSLHNSRGSGAGRLLEGCVDLRTDIHRYSLSGRAHRCRSVHRDGHLQGQFCGQC